MTWWRRLLRAVRWVRRIETISSSLELQRMGRSRQMPWYEWRCPTCQPCLGEYAGERWASSQGLDAIDTSDRTHELPHEYVEELLRDLISD